MADIIVSANVTTMLSAADFAGIRSTLSLTALATTTPGTGVAAALAVNIGTAGAVVVLNGAGGTPSSMVGTNITGTAAGLTAGAVALSGVTGLGANVGTFLGTPTSANLFAALTTKTGSGGVAVFSTGPTISGATLTGSPSIDTPSISGAISFPDGVRQTFNPSAVTPGFNPGSHTADPSTPANGDMWYESTNHLLRVRINGSTVSLGPGSGDVTAAASFGTDNRIIRSDGTGKGVQASAITIDDSGNVTGVTDISGASASVTTLVIGGVTVTASGTELNFVDGVTSAIQTQLNAKANLSGGNTISGTQTLAEGASILLDSVLSADGTWTGTAIPGVSGYAQAFGDVVYLDPTDSRWEACDANAAAGADGDSRGLVGMVVSAGTDGNACTILLQGTIRADANFPALTINNPIYISETAGDITQTQPTTTDVVIRIIGAAITADSMYFNPDHSWITHT